MILLASFACAVFSAAFACPLQDAAGTAPPHGAASAAPLYLDGNVAAVNALDKGELDPSAITSFDHFCEDVITSNDNAVTAVENGITWYGRWEDAVAEVQRTGKPLLVHFGSPRVMQVCGVW